jgi:two-component system CheB/CheR fusion protein
MAERTTTPVHRKVLVPRKVSVPRKVLVIDDEHDVAEGLRLALEIDNHEVAVAHDGTNGLETARAFKPDVVFCDIGMPGMDGYQVARAFRADPALRDVVLIALTGYAQSDDEAKARRAGFDAHLAKPSSMASIQAMLLL